MTPTILWMDFLWKAQSKKKISEIAKVETILGTKCGIG